MTTIPIHPRLMTTSEVAAYLAVPSATLYRWRSAGKGPRSYRVGRGIRYRRSEVEQWLEAQGVEASS